MVLVDIRETPSAQGGRHLPPDPARQGLRGRHDPARARQGPAGERASASRRPALTLEQLQDLVDRMKTRQVRRALLRHGPVDDARQAHELRGGPDAGGGDERLHQVRGHADARPRQRDRRRRGHALDDGLSRSASTCRRGYPRFNPGEFSTVDLLVRGDSDAALILGADPGATMPQPAIDHLARIPTIVLDPKVTHTSRLARVHITTAATGISAPGHGLPHGRDAAAAAAGAEVAVSDRRGGRPPHPPGRSAAKPAGLPMPARPSERASDRVTSAESEYGRHAADHRRKVYDPANGVDGVVRDVCIADGRIVADVEGGRTIDATGMIVFPGGVDVHTHVAGAALNFARGDDRPRTSAQGRPFLHTPERRAGLGGLTPTTFATGYLYAGMGYTTVNEAAVPVLSRQAHARGAARHADRRQGLLRADGQQRDRPGSARGRRDRAGEARRRLADLGGEGVRRQGGQPRRRRGLEVGQERQGALTSRSKATARSRRRRSSRAWPRSSTTSACRTRCTCTATTSACPATSRPRSRR